MVLVPSIGISSAYPYHTSLLSKLTSLFIKVVNNFTAAATAARLVNLIVELCTLEF